MLAPTSPTVAFRSASGSTTRCAMYACDIFTVPVNLAGLPGDLDPVRALRGPAGRACSSSAPAFAENRLLAAAHALEQAIGFDPRAAGLRERLSVERGWEPVIGLEIHVQLNTRTKMFCALREPLRRPAEHAHLPALPRPTRACCR